MEMGIRMLQTVEKGVGGVLHNMAVREERKLSSQFIGESRCELKG